MVKKLIYINIIFAIVLNWFSKNPNFLEYGFSYLNILPKQIFGIVELISIFILLLIIRDLKRKKFFTYSLIFIFSYVVLYTPYVILWDGTIFNVLMGVRNYVSFVPILFGGYYLSKKGYSIRPFLILIVILCLIQIPVTVFQFLVSPSILKRGTIYDAVSGTMGGLNTNVLAILLVSVIIVLITLYLKFKKKNYLLISILLFIPPVLGDAKGVFVLISLSLFLILLLSKLGVQRKAFLIFISVIIFSVLATLYLNIIEEEDRKVLDPTYFLSYELNKEYREGDNVRLSRIESVKYALNLVSENPVTLIFGYGIGNASRNNLYGADGKYFSRITIIHFWDKVITEIGLIGVLTILIVLLRLFLTLKKIEKFFIKLNPFISSLASGMSIVILILIISGFYTDHMSKVQIMYPISLVTGYLISEYSRMKTAVKIKKI